MRLQDSLARCVVLPDSSVPLLLTVNVVTSAGEYSGRSDSTSDMHIQWRTEGAGEACRPRRHFQRGAVEKKNFGGRDKKLFEKGRHFRSPSRAAL